MSGTEDGQEKFAREHGKDIASCADNQRSASCQKGLAMQDALTVALPAGLGSGILAAVTPEIAAVANGAIQSCAGNVVLCLNNAGIQMSEALVPGGVGAGGAVGIGKTAAEATAAKAEVVAANAAKNVSSRIGKINAGKFRQIELNSLLKLELLLNQQLNLVILLLQAEHYRNMAVVKEVSILLPKVLLLKLTNRGRKY